MCFSFGRLAQSWLAEAVRASGRCQERLIWLEKWTGKPRRASLVARRSQNLSD